ncbi:MAG: single-stranded DNA-binding protein [Oscillatoriales cyanobacterium SM2_2_1]|nr:single-stranded DNA-binding protein [Oscillatoriales cyanobacterium SM2_2_1]
MGWNNLAEEIISTYHMGDHVVIEGRLRIDSVDRGTHKEKRTELVAQRIHAVSGRSPMAMGSPTSGVHVFSMGAPLPVAQPAYTPPPAPQPMPEFDDNIPF